MPNRLQGEGFARAGLLLILGTLAAAGGCQSAQRGPNLGVATPPFLSRSSPAGDARAVAGQTVMHWSIASARDARFPAMAGRDLVAGDGTVRLGPYGAVKVAGLTTSQAKAVIEKHVASWVAEPRVGLRLEHPAGRNQVAQTGEPPLDNALVKEWHFSKLSGQAGGAVQTAAATSTGNRTVVPAGGSSRQHAAPRIMPAGVSEPETAPPPGIVLAHPHGGHHQGVMLGQPQARELAMVSLPPYIVEPPDILLVESVVALREQPIRGEHLVRPDGTISLGIYGSVYVAGMTLPQVSEVVYRQIKVRADKVKVDDVHVDVLAYNSKFFYVITDGAGFGQQVFRLPITGSETVLSAVAQVNGLPPMASKKHIWVARPTPVDGGGHQILPVDWRAVSEGGSTWTNYQLLPGDRLFVSSDKLIRFDNNLSKLLNPIERLFGITLLGSTTVNSISGRGQGFGGTGR